jgi:hypothetical protein
MNESYADAELVLDRFAWTSAALAARPDVRIAPKAMIADVNARLLMITICLSC